MEKKGNGKNNACVSARVLKNRKDLGGKYTAR